MDQAQAMFSLANAWLKVKPETTKNFWQHTKILAFKERTICDFEPVEYPTSALPLEEEIVAELNGMLPNLPGNFDNKVTDVSQLNLEADESEMIVCYTTGTTNDEETAEGNTKTLLCTPECLNSVDTNVKVFFLNNIEKKTLLARSLKIDYYHIRSVETDSSLSGPEVKRRKKLTYFNGGGQKMWEIQSSLIMDSVNVSSILDRFRRKSILAAENNKNINRMRVLSLSFVFPVDKSDKNKCISSYLDEEIGIVLLKEAYKGIQLPKVSGDAVLYCKALIDDEDAQLSFTISSDLDDIVVKIAQSFTAGSAMPNNKSEASFIMKIDVAEKNQKKKPDFKLGIMDRKREVYFFYIEIKRPEKESKYQEEDDFVKLMKEMKFSVDRQISLGMKNPLSFGLLCEGFSYSLFRMTLKVDGVYMPIMVKRFSLVSNKSELMNTSLIVEAFGAVKEEFASFEERYKGRNRKENEELSKFMKPSFITKFEK
ncbi:hypothetical protein RO3G_11570 [Rhizopus delemar RA 99-880]|uniref:Uncharacterized protein n=1 Tax=Rhizopus delemar (strain RA 99-880 / ATCC MYA-4621 / FGSC 9543 / NRRL 43880) TaxID=246409 RepID=I1CEH9_RHIO9|nr:hypothetical protein RO3G_11570 [Rhizopus delemar RA 99-880]|eukprot:EIE86859.1 hypothetical protein RO3G_11570 [Rhizopus delemar RA 99-880]